MSARVGLARVKWTHTACHRRASQLANAQAYDRGPHIRGMHGLSIDKLKQQATQLHARYETSCCSGPVWICIPAELLGLGLDGVGLADVLVNKAIGIFCSVLG